MNFSTPRGDARQLLTALLDAETGVRGFLISGDPKYLEPYYYGIEAIGRLRESLGGQLTRWTAPEIDNTSLDQLIRQRQSLMEEILATAQIEGSSAGQRFLRDGSSKQVMDHIRAIIKIVDDRNEATVMALEKRISNNTTLFSVLIISVLGVAILLSTLQFLLFRQEIGSRRAVEQQLQKRNGEIQSLAQLSDALHSANSRDESYTIIKSYAPRILSETAGALYVYSSSRDQLRLAATWGDVPDIQHLAEYFHPDDCWSLRRGKNHVGKPNSSAVNCAHVRGESSAYMCVPISGRGRTLAMLHLCAIDGDAAASRMEAVDLVSNFIDQISLSLVNIELRERLETMAVRDALTGLYNRRFLDEMLDRELTRASRAQSNVAVMMLDVDHFKRFNDSYGHAAGDEVLRQIATFLLSVVRQSDIVCRYGGEELTVVMPDCTPEEAANRAELIRSGIARLEPHIGTTELPPITVSIGVASYPQTAETRLDLIEGADQALYHAKRDGRDRVCFAPHRASAMAALAAESQPAHMAASQ